MPTLAYYRRILTPPIHPCPCYSSDLQGRPSSQQGTLGGSLTCSKKTDADLRLSRRGFVRNRPGVYASGAKQPEGLSESRIVGEHPRFAYKDTYRRNPRVLACFGLNDSPYNSLAGKIRC